MMQVTLDIPENLAQQLESAGRNLSRAALEALALDAYRNDQLSEGEVRQILGFATRMEVHALLKEHRVPLQYTPMDIEQDRLASDEYLSDWLSTQTGKQAA